VVVVEIIKGNCIDVLSSMPASSVDAVVTDPPYGQTSLAWDKWVVGWTAAVDRVLKPSGSMWVFGTLRMFTSHWSEFSDWRLAQDIVWEKHNGSGFQADRFRRVHEQAAHFYRGKWGSVWKGKVVTMDAKKRTVTRSIKSSHTGDAGMSTYTSEEGGPRIMRSVIYARSQHHDALHPTQKPEAVVEPLVLNCCPPGGVVLDPFAGSGTTGVVAQRNGRSAILIEADVGYADVMKKRVIEGVGGG
jgi:site-specific DNA-methyltransferase (adenine-specific)